MFFYFLENYINLKSVDKFYVGLKYIVYELDFLWKIIFCYKNIIHLLQLEKREETLMIYYIYNF